MLKFCRIALLVTLLFAYGCGAGDYTRYVDPFIGTGATGHTFPGACAPFGMVQPSPVTGFGSWDYCSEYVYDDAEILGFTQNHLNGTGCPDLGNVLIMPVTGALERDWNDYRSGYSKQSEKASPGYYSVYLDDAKTKVEITASARVALYRMSYEGDGAQGLLVDLQHGPVWSPERVHTHVEEAWSQWVDQSKIVGYAKDKTFGPQSYFFVIEFNHPAVNFLTLPQQQGEKAMRYVAEFDLPEDEPLMVKVALSSVNVEGAEANVATLADWDFEAQRDRTKASWNALLSRVDVKGSRDEKRNLYTSLYHAFIQPNIHSDVDGRYRNAAGEVVRSEAEQAYTTFSLWDTYRAAHSLYTVLMPERVNDFVVSMLEQGEAQGYLPIWALWGGETHCMIGNHAIPVIAEAWGKGFREYDGRRALELMRRSQTLSHRKQNDWGTYLHYGYYPADRCKSQSVSMTLENAYDDYALARMAEMLGDESLREEYDRRADFFKSVYDAESRCARPRLADGSWQSPFDKCVMIPYKQGGGFTEATPFQYTWHVQHDVDWLIDFMGGKERFVEQLDSLFVGQLVADQPDITGLIGNYAHGNEPCHHIPYLYTLVDRQDRAAEVVREIFDTQYAPRYDGLCGNDDCGQMSAWYIFSAMVFYPVDPVSGCYVLGAPQIEQMELRLADEKSFKVKAEGLSREAKYVERTLLNGVELDRAYITYDEIMQGGELRFVMTDKVRVETKTNVK